MKMLWKLKLILDRKGFRIFTRPYELNIIGLRSDKQVAGCFNDELHVFYTTEKDKWKYHVYKICTDPGSFWKDESGYPKYPLLLAEGQYLNSFIRGKWNGIRQGIIQTAPVTVTLGYDRNAMIDFSNGTNEKGMYGISILNSEGNVEKKYINKDLEGCQVFQNNKDFIELMILAEKHQRLYGNCFTYTLIDFRTKKRESLVSKAFYLLKTIIEEELQTILNHV
jgi:hypothetical protein